MIPSQRETKSGIAISLQTPIEDLEFAAIDFESAGAKKGETDEPIQIGIVTGTIKRGIVQHFDSYLQPKKEVMWQASRVHGITAHTLREKPSLLELWPTVHHYLRGRVLVAHACGTEKRFLKAFAGQKFGPWVDSLTLARAVLPTAPKHQLSSLLPYMDPSLQTLPVLQGRSWHDALYDAAASFCFLQSLVVNLQLEAQPLALLLHPSNKQYHHLRPLR